MRDVNEKIEQLKLNTKGKYITQACAFNKECPRQMNLLKLALENSTSFSGLVKELLAIKFSESQAVGQSFTSAPSIDKPKNKNVGNFL